MRMKLASMSTQKKKPLRSYAANGFKLRGLGQATRVLSSEARKIPKKIITAGWDGFIEVSVLGPPPGSFAARQKSPSLSRSSVYLLLEYPLPPNQVDLTLQHEAISRQHAPSAKARLLISNSYIHALPNENQGKHALRS